MRLVHFVKMHHYCLKDIKKLSEAGRLLVNGKVQKLAMPLKDTDIVTIDGIKLEAVPFAYYLYHKPVGLICTNNEQVNNNYISSLKPDTWVHPVGRLDKESSGLLILTNDYQLSDKILGPNSDIFKVYDVIFENRIDNDFILNLQESVILRGKPTQKCKVEVVSEYEALITLKEGKYHQIRRMTVLSGNRVKALKRIKIGNLTIDGLDAGAYRILSMEEINELINYRG